MTNATERGTVNSWLFRYLSQRKPCNDKQEAAPNGIPFLMDGHTCIFGSDLRQWLQVSWQEKVTPQELGRYLKNFGASPITINVKVEEKWTSMSAWKLPIPKSKKGEHDNE